MSQATTWGLPESGPKAPVTYSQEGNESFDAILTQHSDATARPEYAVAGTTWLKTVSATQNEVYHFDGTDDILLYTVNYTTNEVTVNLSNGAGDLTVSEVNQLANIGTTTISAAQWVYLGAQDQGTSTTDSPTFAGLTTNTGIYISGTTSADLLEDFERGGTFTPTIDFGGGSTGITYGTNIGRYQVVGDMVTATVNIILTSKGTDTGTLNIKGLPFASESVVEYHAQPYLTAVSYSGNVTVYALPGNSVGRILIFTEAGGTSFFTDSNMTDTTKISLTLNYKKA